MRRPRARLFTADGLALIATVAALAIGTAFAAFIHWG